MNKLTTISITLAMLTASAFAGDPKPPEAKKAPEAKAPDAKAPDAKAPDAKAAPMEMPKPAKELVDMGKQVSGTWKCTGTASMGSAPLDVKGTITSKMDLDNFWIQTSLNSTVGKMPFKFTQYTGFDGKKWHRYSLDNMGSVREMESAGMTDGKIVWEGQHAMGGMTMKARETEEMGKDKTFHTVGEMSMDGKTWNKDHDVTCKK